MASIPYSEIKKELHKNPEFVREYEALAEEFRTAEKLIRALMAAGAGAAGSTMTLTFR